jgi:hypothetical protein
VFSQRYAIGYVVYEFILILLLILILDLFVPMVSSEEGCFFITEEWRCFHRGVLLINRFFLEQDCRMTRL